jgi:putative ATP-binding cassette transporter
MSFIVALLATVWRLAVPYFRSEEKWRGRGLLATVIAIELAIVAINVLITQWNARFFNALQERNWDTFVAELLFFCTLAAMFIVLRVYQTYVNQWLQIRWRNWLTARYLARWLDGAAHYRMQLTGEAADNPDQRIAEDIKQFIELTLFMLVGILSAVVTFCSYVVLLWTLSAEAPLTLFGREFAIPGYLVWIGVIYSVLGTLITHAIGRALIGLNFNQQRFEADFRFNLVRVRENAEQIALLAGEATERAGLLSRFTAVMNNWFAIMARQKKLIFFTASFNQASVVFPYVVASPAYFAGRIQLGGLMQIASAFGQLQAAVSFFVDATYLRFAEWQAVIARLVGFDAAIHAAHAQAATRAIAVNAQPAARRIALSDLVVHLPNGEPMVSAAALSVDAGARMLVTGPSGAGKSTLFRAIAGIWPHGSGTVTIPAGARLMMLPQRPYFPIGTLRGAIAYPAAAETFADEQLRHALDQIGLPTLADRLDEQAHWNRQLSLGEQQRLGLARALLHKPDYLFLDEATASLDEPSEAAMYRLLDSDLPDSTIVSIGHRSTLTEFHRSEVTLVREGTHHAVSAVPR